MVRIHQLLMFSALMKLLAQSWASSFSISPIILEVPSPGSIATYRLDNTGGDPVTVQTSVSRWHQDGKNIHEPANEMVVVPGIAEISPGSSQTIRIARPEGYSDSEKAYRVHFQEVPDTDETQSTILRALLRVNAPLFFTLPDSEPSLRWSAVKTATADQVALGAINTGGRYRRFDSISLMDQSGKTVASFRQPFYVLGHSNHIRIIETSRPLDSGEQLRLLLEQTGSVEEKRITVD